MLSLHHLFTRPLQFDNVPSYYVHPEGPPVVVELHTNFLTSLVSVGYSAHQSLHFWQACINQQAKRATAHGPNAQSLPWSHDRKIKAAHRQNNQKVVCPFSPRFSSFSSPYLGYYPWWYPHTANRGRDDSVRGHSEITSHFGGYRNTAQIWALSGHLGRVTVFVVHTRFLR